LGRAGLGRGWARDRLGAGRACGFGPAGVRDVAEQDPVSGVGRRLPEGGGCWTGRAAAWAAVMRGGGWGHRLGG
jgi:hypothetical protein